jgi:pyridoxine 5-phosphate synthase
MASLGVNIDHVATVRQARRTVEPDPVWAAAMCELGGADQITVHLREDRRHIQDRDLEILVKTVRTRVNLELAVEADVVNIACKLKPACACLVPERREEVTTEGGLDVAGKLKRVTETVKRLNGEGIEVSLFIDAEPKQIEAAAKSGAPFIEIHTGEYAHAVKAADLKKRIEKIAAGARLAQKLGLQVNAGHGLTYQNVQPIARIAGMQELNIGHSIVSRALFVGLTEAVREMKRLIVTA